MCDCENVMYAETNSHLQTYALAEHHVFSTWNDKMHLISPNAYWLEKKHNDLPLYLFQFHPVAF